MPSALPIATTASPTWSGSESPSSQRRQTGLVDLHDREVVASCRHRRRRRCARRRRRGAPSLGLAPSTTCAFVTITPLGSTMKPVPVASADRSRADVDAHDRRRAASRMLRMSPGLTITFAGRALLSLDRALRTHGLRLRIVVDRDEQAAGDQRTDERAGDATDDGGRMPPLRFGVPARSRVRGRSRLAPAAGWRASVLHAHDGGGGSLPAGAGMTGSTGGSESVRRPRRSGSVPSVAELVHAAAEPAGGLARRAGRRGRRLASVAAGGSRRRGRRSWPAGSPRRGRCDEGRDAGAAPRGCRPIPGRDRGRRRRVRDPWGSPASEG